MLTDYGLAYYQNMRLVAERERRSALESMALAGLRSDVQAVRDLGNGKYELTLYFWNVSGEPDLCDEQRCPGVCASR